ncbi:RNA polymerase subunit sigma-70 [Streptomyces sp. NPDC059248]|uniref:RNA polymerase subunit sigma-70 n=1 Tax=Streptomyces sp. NPDC059248 TaxID=3346791 RepID=UPI0036847CB8
MSTSGGGGGTRSGRAAAVAAGPGEPSAETIRTGGEEVFSVLAERYRHELRVHVYRMLGSFTDAEDLVQETLLKAWRRREGFEGRSTFRAWLYRIATNTALDFLDGPARHREVALAVDSAGSAASAALAEVTWLQPYPDELLDLAAPGHGEPHTAAVARETVELAFLAAIQHLPPRQRAVLILRDIAGWPARETADTLGMSIASVKSALQRARTTLRDHLPERRADWGAATEPSAAERAVLQRYMAASRDADLSALALLLREDVRQAMPPHHLIFDGRAAVLDLWRPVLEGDGAWGEWRSVAYAVNRQPAAVNYVRRPGEDVFTAVNADVLRIEDGLIAEITTFDPGLLPGVPPTLALVPGATPPPP